MFFIAWVVVSDRAYDIVKCVSQNLKCKVFYKGLQDAGNEIFFTYSYSLDLSSTLSYATYLTYDQSCSLCHPI